MNVRPSVAATAVALAGLLAAGCSPDATPAGTADDAESPTAASTAPQEEGDEEPEPEEPEAEEEAAAADGPFSMEVMDRFKVSGQDEPVATGVIASGTVAVGDELCLDGVSVTVVGLESFRELVDAASAGDNVGILLDGVSVDDIEVGTELRPC